MTDNKPPGIEHISVCDRSQPLPAGYHLKQVMAAPAQVHVK